MPLLAVDPAHGHTHCTTQLWQQYAVVVIEEATAWLSLLLPQPVLGALSMYGKTGHACMVELALLLLSTFWWQCFGCVRRFVVVFAVNDMVCCWLLAKWRFY